MNVMDFIVALASAAAAVSVPGVAFDKIVLTPSGSHIIGSFSSQEACAADVAKESSLQASLAAALMVSGQDQARTISGCMHAADNYLPNIQHSLKCGLRALAN